MSLTRSLAFHNPHHLYECCSLASTLLDAFQALSGVLRLLSSSLLGKGVRACWRPPSLYHPAEVIRRSITLTLSCLQLWPPGEPRNTHVCLQAMAPLCREPPVFGPDVMGSQTLRAFGSAFWFGPSSHKVLTPRPGPCTVWRAQRASRACKRTPAVAGPPRGLSQRRRVL